MAPVAAALLVGLGMPGLLLFLAIGSPCLAQNGAPLVDPKPFGIDLPPGPLTPGNGQSVTTLEQGALVVGRLYVQIGDAAVIQLPDGQLVPRKKDEFTFCDRKFEPLAPQALAKRLVAEFKDFKCRHHKQYIFVYKSSDEFFLGTSTLLQTMFAGVKGHARNCGIEVHEPEFPLVVILFPNAKEFRSYRAVPDGVTAYYHPITNRVVLHEPVELGEKSRQLAISQAVSTVAHEGAHQILHNIGVQQRLSAWPMWLSEGLAEYFAPTTFGKNLSWKGAGEKNDLRMFELQRYLRDTQETPPDGRMIEQTVVNPNLNSSGYASAWAITHFLIKNQKAKFAGLLREVSLRAPLEGEAGGNIPVIANLDQFRRHFGDDVASLERQLVSYLKRLPYKDPFAEMPHYLVQVFVTVDKKVRTKGEVFYSSMLADEWAKREIANLPPDEQALAYYNVIDFPNRLAAEAYKKDWLRKP